MPSLDFIPQIRSQFCRAPTMDLRAIAKFLAYPINWSYYMSTKNVKPCWGWGLRTISPQFVCVCLRFLSLLMFLLVFQYFCRGFFLYSSHICTSCFCIASASPLRALLLHLYSLVPLMLLEADLTFAKLETLSVNWRQQYWVNQY